MDSGTLMLAGVAAGLLLGAASSVVTRRVGVLAGIVFALVIVAVGLVVWTARGEDALLPVVACMLAFSVAASVLDARLKGPSHSTR